MRIYNPIVNGLGIIDTTLNDSMGLIERKYYAQINRALVSVRNNNASLLICDDTSRNENWAQHHTRLSKLMEENGFTEGNNLFIAKSEGNRGSSLSMWYLRRLFIEVTRNEPDSFAIILDQDDELENNAVRHIGDKMSDNAVVISEFSVSDSENLNIITEKKELLAKLNILKRFSVYIPYYPSIGWTKAYSKGAMERMVRDFEKYFNDTNDNIDSFFKKHKAYDDFLDLYILLHADTQIRINSHKSHIYHKHRDSITANANIEDFTITRAVMLDLLCKLCSHNEDKLRNKWEKYLIRFLTVKINDIEAILSKYRNESRSGKPGRKVFEEKTYPGSFAELLISNHWNKYIQKAERHHLRHTWICLL